MIGQCIERISSWDWPRQMTRTFIIYYSLATHQTCPALLPASPILHRLLPHTKHRTTTIYSHRSVQMVRITEHCETFNPLQLHSTFFHTVHTIAFKTNTPMATPIIRCKIHDAGIISLLEQHLIIFKILLHPLKYLLWSIKPLMQRD